jgi:predicted transposase YbfD/YdcC
VAYPLPELLLLVVCGTIAACDDYDDIRDWGEAHLGFLRRFLPYHHGLPCADWLRTLMNRLDPALFSACFMAWAREVRPDAPALIAIDGKTLRRSHDRGAGRQALHLVSAFATNERLVLGQEAVEDTSCEQVAIPALLRRLADAGALKGAVVTIDAIACNPTIATAIVENGADYLLSVKQNQPNLLAEIASAFAQAGSLDVAEAVDKGHGRIETRRVRVSHEVGWMASNRRFPGECRFPQLAALIRVEAIRESKGHISTEQRYYIASAPLTAAQAAHAIRGHWRIENALHWVLDVTFREDLSRLRIGYGAENMALVRHFALNLLRTTIDSCALQSTSEASKHAANGPASTPITSKPSSAPQPVNPDSLP